MKNMTNGTSDLKKNFFVKATKSIKIKVGRNKRFLNERDEEHQHQDWWEENFVRDRDEDQGWLEERFFRKVHTSPDGR